MSSPQPLQSPPASDGMELGAGLTSLWNSIPPSATIAKLRGDASSRSYYRVACTECEPRSIIVMRLPADALQGDEGGESARPSELPFVNVHRHLANLGVPVPELYVDDTARGVLLLEDLGDETFEARLIARGKQAWHELYGQAVDLLASMQQRADGARNTCVAYARSFDRTLLRWELEHFREWGLEALDTALSAQARGLLDASFALLTERMLTLPQGFVHRDYQSRNLMWAPRSASGELVVIDFQDALQGPAVYDLVALLCDSYVDLDESLQRAMIARLAQAKGVSADELERAFWLVAVQRKLKDAGRFVFIDQVRGNPDFLRWFAPSLRYVGRALAHLPELTGLRNLLAEVVPGFPECVGEPPARTSSQRHRKL